MDDSPPPHPSPVEGEGVRGVTAPIFPPPLWGRLKPSSGGFEGIEGMRSIKSTRCSVPEWLTGFQGVFHARQGRLGPDQGHEGRALQLEQVLGLDRLDYEVALSAS